MADDYNPAATPLAADLLARASRSVRERPDAADSLREAARVALVAFQIGVSAAGPSGHPLPLDDLGRGFADQDVIIELGALLRGEHPDWAYVAELFEQAVDGAAHAERAAVTQALEAFDAAFVGALRASPAFADSSAVPEPSGSATLDDADVQDLLALLRQAPLPGGAINAGRITATNVVSGQQIIVNVNRTVADPLARARAQSELLRPYLEQILVTCATPAFGDPTRSLVDAESQGSMALDRLWTPLRVADFDSDPAPVDDAAHRAAPTPVAEAEAERPIADVAAEPGTILVLGGPGSGKSTAVAYLAATAARTFADTVPAEPEDPAPVPIRVLLRDVAVSAGDPSTDDLWSGVAELGILRRDQARDVGAIEQALLERLRDGRAVLFLDGLDEVREDLLPSIRTLIGVLSQTWSRARILVTCRTYDYLTPEPNRRIVATRTVRLLPYRFDDARDYVEHWYAEAARVGRFTADDATSRREGLLASLADYPALRELAATPLLLALLTLVHSEEGSLPDSRAMVSERAVRYLLAESASWHGGTGPTVATSEMTSLAQHVAYTAQSRLEKLGREFRGLTRTELRQIVSDYFHLDDQPVGDRWSAVAETVQQHLSRLVQSNGLLVDQGQGVYAFAHRSFQEFLAGQYFAPGTNPEEALRAAQDPNWRESFRLLAGYGSREGGAFFYLLSLIDDLQQPLRADGMPAYQPADAVLAGEMLLEMGRSVLESKGYQRVLRESPLTAGPDGLWCRVAARIAEVVAAVPPVLPAAERVRGAIALGGLGDPRTTTPTGDLIPLSDRMVMLPAGTFTIGSPDGRGEPDEHPQRTHDFPAFGFGRHLVTNREYAEFVAAGCYHQEQWWEDGEARLWMSNDPAFLAEVQQTWIATVRTYHAKELRDGEIREEELSHDAALRCAPRAEPFYWRNPRFNRPNQPVVGVTWWESRAYAAWLTGQGHGAGWLDASERLRLPTEGEWERAGRDVDDGRTFPWGELWDDDRAHTRTDGLELLEPTPIGCYPHGTWPGGPADLCGNVWEWLEDRKLSYDPAFDASRLDVHSLDERAIRGSSWYNTAALARCSARFVDRPFNLYFDVGFRLVRVG